MLLSMDIAVRDLGASGPIPDLQGPRHAWESPWQPREAALVNLPSAQALDLAASGRGAADAILSR